MSQETNQKTPETEVYRTVETGEIKNNATESAEAAENTATNPNASAGDESNPEGNDNLGGELASVKQELEQARNQILRTQADFDNFRRRTRQEKEELQTFATKKLLTELLPVVDNFDRALDAFTEGADLANVKTGVEMVHRQLIATLDRYGVKPMEVVGQPFNPNFHEAVMQEPAEGQEPNTVVQELQKGYLIQDKVLRPAMVKVTV